MSCTVVIPVFNQRAFVSRAVASSLQQPAGTRVVVVDNCSDDGTWEALQGFAGQGVELHRNAANLGLFGNFNRCLELVRTPYFRLLSGDDLLPPGCLDAELACMARHPGVAVLSTRGRFVSPQGAALGWIADVFPAGIYEGSGFSRVWFEYYARYRRNPLNYPSGVLFRRAAVGELRFEREWQTAGDLDFYFKVLRHGDLAIAHTHGCDVTRHAGQAHIQPNLDGTAMREQLALLERHVAPRVARSLRKYLAGTCLVLALRRMLSRHSRGSAAIHWRLARTVSPGAARAALGAASLPACRVAQALLGKRAPYVPRPLRAL